MQGAFLKVLVLPEQTHTVITQRCVYGTTALVVIRTGFRALVNVSRFGECV